MNSIKVSNRTPNLTTRIARTEHRMAYVPRGIGLRSLHSTVGVTPLKARLGEPTTEGRKTGEAEYPWKRGMRNARCQGLLGTHSRTRYHASNDASPESRMMRKYPVRFGGGRWKSIIFSCESATIYENSPAAYPTMMSWSLMKRGIDSGKGPRNSLLKI